MNIMNYVYIAGRMGSKQAWPTASGNILHGLWTMNCGKAAFGPYRCR